MTPIRTRIDAQTHTYIAFMTRTCIGNQRSVVIPAQAGIQRRASAVIPAKAGIQPDLTPHARRFED